MNDKYSNMEREEIEIKATYNFNNYGEVIQNFLKGKFIERKKQKNSNFRNQGVLHLKGN